MIERAIFVLTDRETGQRFLTILPDLLDIGLADATILHLLPSRRGPVEPMPELANWVRHFELSVEKVELALKRGDPVRWIFDLARVREAQLVVLAAPPDDAAWDFERVSSPLRGLGVPILYLPDGRVDGSFLETVVIAVKTPATLDREVPRLRSTLRPRDLRAIHVTPAAHRPGSEAISGIRLETVPADEGVATTILEYAAGHDATLVVVLADEDEGRTSQTPGSPVVGPLIADADRPILVWPTAPEPSA